jgi:hypothetical protein
MRYVAALLPQSPYPAALWAFLAGVACHVETDQAFHPLVTYLTGNDDVDRKPHERTQSVQDHHRLECLMDLYFCGGAKGLRRHSLGDIVRNLELPLAYLIASLCEACAAICDVPPTVAIMREALGNFQSLQGLFRRRLIARILAMIAPALPAKGQEVATLFYSPSLEAHLPRITGQMTYRNPVSGMEEKATLCDLFGRAVAGGVDLIGKIEAAIRAGGPVLPEKGLPLSCGVMGDDMARPRYFAARRFFMNDVRSAPLDASNLTPDR